jgi:hypothetical protein
MTARALVSTALLALVAVVASAAHGQTLVASFAGLTGTVEVQHDAKGEWAAVTVGSPFFASDAVRSGAGAAAKLIFVDDAVLNVGPSTEVAVEHYVGGKGARRSLLRLTQGKIEVLVSGYGGESARYEVESPTALARVQGTDFIVRYDAAAQATDVVGLEGTVAVQGLTGIIGPGVAVGPNEVTRVPRDGFPSPAKAVDAAEARDFVQGLQLIGTGTRESLDTDNPIVEGRLVGAADRPVAGGLPAPAAEAPYLQPGVPGQTLIQTLSPDIRANTQPLPEYRAVPPNAIPVPPH